MNRTAKTISRKVRLLPGALLLLFAACTAVDGSEEEVVAEVYGERLTRSDLAAKMPPEYATEDSAGIAGGIVSAWVRDQAMLKTAEENLTEVQKDVQKQLEDYRKSLLIYAYERAMVSQKIDTLVTEEEIAAYYESNAENFRLQRYIVKVRFVKIAEDAPRQKQIEAQIKNYGEEDVDALYEYSRKYAENFYFNSEVWLFPEDLLKEVPLPVNDPENFLRQHKFHTFDRDGFRYFLFVEDYRGRGDPSPLSLERRRIRDLILSRRKAELLGKLREEIVAGAIAEGHIKIRETP